GWYYPSWTLDRYDFTGPRAFHCPNVKRLTPTQRLCWVNEVFQNCNVAVIGMDVDLIESIAHQTACKIHVFDCYQQYGMRPHLKDRVHYYPLCLHTSNVQLP